MKVRSIPNFVSAAALAAALQVGISSAHAVSAPAVPLSSDEVIQPSQFQRVEWTEEKRTQLRRAFWLLEHANGDYEGHRAKAMEHIKKAGEGLGIDIHGPGYTGPHPQGKSDERLIQAKELLRKMYGEGVQGKEEKHIAEAVAEINHALKMK